MKQSENEIITNVRKLLKEKKITQFIGYEQTSDPMFTSPCIVSCDSEASKLVWNGFCTNNLAVYIPRISASGSAKESKIGILCKGCDCRSLVELIKEQQIKREQIFVIGISCTGIINQRRLKADIGDKKVINIAEDGQRIVVRCKEGEVSFERAMYLCRSCQNCAHPAPHMYDILIRSEQFSPALVSPDPVVQDFRSKSRAERWELFEKEISRCIRCYACRNVCPNCYCKECFAEQTNPRWIGVSDDPSDKQFFHMMRIFHHAGRCVDCGACVRACPMNIDLRIFTRMLVDEVRDRFGYEPGVSLKESAPLAAYTMNDKQEFMTEPD
jgi:formate dehydrogenase subunit beta